MIARLIVGVPFTLAIPDTVRFSGYAYEEDGYRIAPLLPVRSEFPIGGSEPTDVRIDDGSAILTNALRFDFHRDTFQRARDQQELDPPIALLQKTVSGFIARLRYVTRSQWIQDVDLLRTTAWNLEYLDDSGAQLPPDPLLLRSRGAQGFSASLTAINPSVWEAIHSLDSDWRPPVWDDLLLDASAAAPHIGTTVALAATALEAFIAEVLERYAASGSIPADVWAWINRRDSHLKTPSTEEQYDVLLKHFCGHSLKEDARLWQAFSHIRTARNKFVHEGVARVGGVPVTQEQAAGFVKAANDIVALVRSWLPSSLQWPQFTLDVRMSFTLQILKPTEPAKAT